jgi:putative copper resistance protein D
VQVALGLTAAAVLTGGLLAALAPSLAAQYGLPEPGPAVDVGLPFARVLALGAGAACVGNLLLAAALAPGEPGPGAVVSPSGYAGLRAARWWALAQGVASAAVAVLTALENTGIPPGRALANGPALLVGLEQIEPATGWLIAASVALLVAGFAGWVLGWRGTVGLLVFALSGPLCVALTAATNAQRSHDIAGDAQALRLVAAVLWLGSAIAVATAPAGRRDRPATMLRRHAAIARWCLAIVAVTGVVSTAYAMGELTPAALVGRGYGRLTLAGAALLVALAVVVAARARTEARARRLVGLEVALLVAAACVDTALARLIPPAELSYEPSRQIYLIGHDLPATMTPLDLATRWRPDLVLGSLAILAAVLYLLGVRRLRRNGARWPARHTAAWLAGCAVLLVATCSGLGNYGPAVFSVHLVQHMLLATLAPALLVLGHGLTLAGRASTEGTARRLADLLDTPAARLAGDPVAALAATAIMLFGLYPTGLFAAIVREHWAHLAMNGSALLTGLALFWCILGHGPGRRPLPAIGQIVTVFAVMALHAGFAAWLLGRSVPVAAVFYGSLHLPFVPDTLADQRLGAVLAWALGELPVIIAVVALVLRWSRDDRAPGDVNDITASGDRELAGSFR